MKHSPSLTGTTLRFDRSGNRLLGIEPDAVTVTHVASGETTRLPFAGVRAVAGFDDQLWLATRDDRLVRVDWSGAAIGAPIALPFAERAELLTAPCGPAAAVWQAASPVVFAESAAAFTHTAQDIVIPLTNKRVVVARGARVTLLSGAHVELAPSSTVLGGCVTADGKQLALVVAHAKGRQLVIIALGTAQIVWRGPIGLTDTVAIGQAAAVIQVEPRVVRVIDLRANRDLGTMSVADDIVTLAIDPAGRTLATRGADGKVELHRIEVGVRRPTAPIPTTPEVEANASASSSTADDRDDAGADAGDDRESMRPRLTFTSDGRVSIPGATAAPMARNTIELELVAPKADDLDATIAPTYTPDTDSEAENVAMIPRLHPPTTIDWINGGADHLGGYY